MGSVRRERGEGCVRLRLRRRRERERRRGREGWVVNGRREQSGGREEGLEEVGVVR